MEPFEIPTCAIVIDDEPEVLELVEWTLKKTGMPVEVMPFQCPEAALEFFERLANSDFPLPEPTIIFCDIKMPKVDGFEVIERIRAMKKFDGVPVYVISTSVQPRDRARAVASGANGHLAKFPSTDDFAELLATA